MQESRVAAVTFGTSIHRVHVLKNEELMHIIELDKYTGKRLLCKRYYVRSILAMWAISRCQFNDGLTIK